MKKLFALIAAMTLTASAFAQKTFVSGSGYEIPANEVSLSVGVLSYPHMVMGFGGILASAFTAGNAEIDACNTVGAYSFEYMRYVHPHVAVGGIVTYEACRLKMVNKDGTPQDSHWQHFMSAIPAVKFPWFSKEHVSMYSKAALGLMADVNEAYSTTDSNGEVEETPSCLNISLGFQVTPVGIDFGGRSFRGFVETGFGVSGLVLGGLRYCF